jgi:glyoxylase-like metal-dependent hydrolase (beta-lactamase superfamily II)
MDHFRIGELEVSRVEEFITHFDAPMFYPDLRPEVLHANAGWLRPFFDIAGNQFPCVFQSFVVRYRRATILIDTCIGNDKERPDFPTAHRLNTPYLDRLKTAGCTPEDVDFVLCTHMHVDHVGWNTRLENGRWVPTFRNAKYVFSRDEYARYDPENRTPDAPPPFLDIYEDSVLPVIQAGQALLVEGEYAVNELLTVVPAPGHTPGHFAVRAGKAGDSGIFLGDVIHNPVQIADPDLNSSFCEDPLRARQTRRRILDEAAEGNALLVPGHFAAPHIGRVRRDKAGFLFLPELGE